MENSASRIEHPVIIGGGPVGLVLALTLCQYDIPVTILEAQAKGGSYGDGRALALSYGTRQTLEKLGVWTRLQANVTAIEIIHVSQQKGFGRTLLKAEEHGLPALGYVVSYGALMQALDARLDAIDQINMQYGVAVQQLHVNAHAALITSQCSETDSVQTMETPLAIIADGGRTLDALPGLVRETKAYGHDALVALVKTALPHHNIAYERFTPHGPMALLPNGDHFSLVWTGEKSYMDKISTLNESEFLHALHQAFGDRVGSFLHVGKRFSFPLKLSYLRQTFPGHCVVVGNAAQTMHPVAGQGFNVGIRDALALAKNIAETPVSEWGMSHQLAAYRQARARDTERGLLFTDFLVNVFSNDIPGVGFLRGTGLGLLGLFPGARQYLVNKMSYGA